MPAIPMPPPFRTGLRLEFNAELTEVRHNLVVLYLTQLNKVSSGGLLCYVLYSSMSWASQLPQNCSHNHTFAPFLDITTRPSLEECAKGQLKEELGASPRMHLLICSFAACALQPTLNRGGSN